MNNVEEPKGAKAKGVGSDVVLVLVLMFLLMLLVHFLQPAGRVTESSSASGSHEK